ncbi:hypothetical protein K402DRAFT_422487 [Aulographum hederae CBS 113979]|uniref:Uncharacterized protein n=1 Tax=Aulographum hederae CBS 113979 TaxID=1176131 RepID=A0A6G1GV85_9PEZI|nr:hypothetical protein K402DRAFT_422487 [Aulographum hederae CBS 113979]
MQRNIVIFLIILILFIVIAIVGYLIFVLQDRLGMQKRGTITDRGVEFSDRVVERVIGGQVEYRLPPEQLGVLRSPRRDRGWQRRQERVQEENEHKMERKIDGKKEHKHGSKWSEMGSGIQDQSKAVLTSFRGMTLFFETYEPSVDIMRTETLYMGGIATAFWFRNHMFL